MQAMSDCGLQSKRDRTNIALSSKYKADNIFPNPHNLDIVQATLTDTQDKWNQILQGVSYVILTVTPIDSKMKESDMIKVANQGVESVLKAAIKNREKKIVFTSSVHACNMKDKIIDESSWNDPKIAKKYPLSKTLSEMLAYDIFKSQTGDYKTEFCTMLPVFVVGPNILPKPQSTLYVVLALMNNYCLSAHFQMPIVDLKSSYTCFK